MAKKKPAAKKKLKPKAKSRSKGTIDLDKLIPMHKAPRDATKVQVVMLDGKQEVVLFKDRSWRYDDENGTPLSAEDIIGWYE